MDLYKILDYGVTAFIAVYAVFSLGGKMNEIVVKLTYLESIIENMILNKNKEETKL